MSSKHSKTFFLLNLMTYAPGDEFIKTYHEKILFIYYDELSRVSAKCMIQK